MHLLGRRLRRTDAGNALRRSTSDYLIQMDPHRLAEERSLALHLWPMQLRSTGRSAPIEAGIYDNPIGHWLNLAHSART
jgi:hypothetical protein